MDIIPSKEKYFPSYTLAYDSSWVVSSRDQKGKYGKRIPGSIFDSVCSEW